MAAKKPKVRDRAKEAPRGKLPELLPQDGRRRPPTEYSTELAKRICSHVASGMSVNHICRTFDWAPDKTTVWGWLVTKADEFAPLYWQAKAAQADALASEIQDIADEAYQDVVYDEDGNEVVRREVIERSKIRIDARKWIASKMNGKRYGEKAQLEVSGPGGGPIQTINGEMTAKEAADLYQQTVGDEK